MEASNVHLLRRFAWLAGLLVAIVTGWNSRDVVGFQFVAWDDDINIYLNPHLGPPSASNLEWMLTDTAYMRRYVPLGWLGFSSVYAVSGLSPAGYHRANLALHIVNALLLYVLLWRVLRRWNVAGDDRWGVGFAAVGALLWSLHPLRIEIVAWASGLLYGLAVLFALLSLLAYCDEPVVNPRKSRRWLATLLYACSLLAYPIALGLVFVFVAIDVADGRRPSGERRTQWWQDPWIRARLLEKIPFVLAAAAIGAGTVAARYVPSSFWAEAPTLAELTPSDRLARGCYTWAYYLWKSAWPDHLSPAPTALLEFSAGEARALASVALVVSVTVVLWLRRSRGPGPLLLWLSYLGVMFPMLGFTEQQFFTCDRYSHLAAMTLSVAGAAALARGRYAWRPTLLGLAVAFLGLLAVLQRAQLAVWKDTDAMFARIIREARGADFVGRSYQRWALYHAQRGEESQAKAVLAAAEKNGMDQARRAAIAAAIARYRTTSDETSGAVGGAVTVDRLHAQLGSDAARVGRRREAREHFLAALALESGNALARYNYALLCALEGDARAALHLYLGQRLGDSGVAPAAERRLAASIARAFAAAQQWRLAEKAIELALRDAPTEERAALKAEAEHYGRAATGRPAG